MLSPVRLGGVWDWIMGRKEKTEPEPVLDSYTPAHPVPPAPPAPSETLTFADPAVEDLCQTLRPALKYRGDEDLMKAGASLQVAQTQLGLAGVALQLIQSGRNDEEKASLAVAAVQALPGPQHELGAEMCRGVRYPLQKLALAQLALGSTATEAVGLAGLGLAATRALDASYSGPDINKVAETTLRRLDTPSARLGLQLGSKVRYEVQKTEIYQTFLAQPEAPDLIALAMQAAKKLDVSYSGPDLVKMETFLVNEFSHVPALGLARDVAKAMRYDAQTTHVLETGLRATAVPDEPRALLEVGVKMVRGLDSSYSGPDQVKGSLVLMERLKKYPETAAMADLATLMMGAVRYDVQKLSLANTVFDAVLAGDSSQLGVAEKALGTLDLSYGSTDFSKVAVAVLERSDNADATLVLKAMKSVRYDAQRIAMAKVIFRHLVSPDPPPYSKLARELMESFDLSYGAPDAVKAGTILSGRYSNPRARAALDGALGRQYDSERATALVNAFREIESIDDDVTEIKNMAKAISGQAPTSTVVEQQGAVLVGGVRLRTRKNDIESSAR